MFKPRSSYNSVKDVNDAMKEFAGIHRPVRCEILAEDGRIKIYDVLPLGITCNSVEVLSLKKEHGFSKGSTFLFSSIDIQLIQSCEPIEVNDFDWRSYLDEKTA